MSYHKLSAMAEADLEDDEDDLEEKEADEESEAEEEEPEPEDKGKGDKADDEEDKPDARKGEREDDDEEDPTLSDVDARREAKRQAKREKRQRQREAREAKDRVIQSMQRQIQDLSGQLVQLSKKGSANDIAQIDASIEAHQQAYRQAVAKMEQTMGKDPAAFTKALEARDQIRDRYNNLMATKNRLVNLESKAGRPMIDPTVMQHARKFSEDHKWYDIQGRDADSKVVLALDEALVDEGFVPSTPEYWKELRTRARRALPHRFEGERFQSGGRVKLKGKPGSMGAGGVKKGVQSSKGVALSKERREAMLQAGLKPGSKGWEEQRLAYAKYDKEHKQRS